MLSQLGLPNYNFFKDEMRISAKEIKETVYYGRLQMLNNIKQLFPRFFTIY